MKYYVTADIHSFFTPFKAALTDSGFFADKDPHKLIVCGDLFDRGKEPRALQDFILDLMDKDQVILIKGNHEDMMLDLIKEWKKEEYFQPYCISNGTTGTVIQLTGASLDDLDYHSDMVYEKLLATPYIHRIIPAMLNYFETEHYIFVHGWIPCSSARTIYGKKYFSYHKDWRNADAEAWDEARWINGMEAAYHDIIEKDKTIVCGHFHTSFGHFYYENEGEEFGNNSNFAPYYAKGIIAIDACTAFSGKVNCIVLED